MELSFAFFASAAEVSPDGRFNLLGGGVDRLQVSTLPTFLPASLVVRFTVPPDAAGREHPPDMVRRLHSVSDAHESRLWDKSGSILVTTDFRPTR
jgi:hypothetical protein